MSVQVEHFIDAESTADSDNVIVQGAPDFYNYPIFYDSSIFEHSSLVV
jgi:hypothetical protein